MFEMLTYEMFIFEVFAFKLFAQLTGFFYEAFGYKSGINRFISPLPIYFWFFSFPLGGFYVDA